jgi:hypothetical protein
MPRSALQRADCQLFLLAFLVGWQAALIYRLTGTISQARREVRAARGRAADALDLLHERDLAAAVNGNGPEPRTWVAPEQGPAEARADSADGE